MKLIQLNSFYDFRRKLGRKDCAELEGDVLIIGCKKTKKLPFYKLGNSQVGNKNR